MPSKRARSTNTAGGRAPSAADAPPDGGIPAAPPRGNRELIVIGDLSEALGGPDVGVTNVAALATAPGRARPVPSETSWIQPLFGATEARVRARLRAASSFARAEVPDLTRYYRVQAPNEQLDEVAAQLREHPAVAAAYVKPAPEPAFLNTMRPAFAPAPPITPDFTAGQLYLDPAPRGVDARFAWTRPGGKGTGVSIIDVEGAWRFSHEDLAANQGGLIAGTEFDDVRWRNHGTAVIGVIGADASGIGVTGICPDANVRAVAIGGLGSAAAIRKAADSLRPGDILLIELHRPGPAHDFAERFDQRGYIALEWWPDDFAAIQYATTRGVIVVEAAGNGAQNLDDDMYEIPAAGFPQTWRNPFRRANCDAGAIVVGAGAPPVGTHGRDHGPDRSRLDFSNYGSCVDAQGWGREVTTTGYGDLQGPADAEDEWYTDQFSGTSSASPVVVGVLGCVQGMLAAARQPRLTPETARRALRATGSPQQHGPSGPATQRIGNLPDLRALAAHVLGDSEPSERLKEASADTYDGGDGDVSGSGAVTVRVRRGEVLIRVGRSALDEAVSRTKTRTSAADFGGEALRDITGTAEPKSAGTLRSGDMVVREIGGTFEEETPMFGSPPQATISVPAPGLYAVSISIGAADGTDWEATVSASETKKSGTRTTGAGGDFWSTTMTIS